MTTPRGHGRRREHPLTSYDTAFKPQVCLWTAIQDETGALVMLRSEKLGQPCRLGMLPRNYSNGYGESARHVMKGVQRVLKVGHWVTH
jgi:hypothetical protein